VSPIFPSALSQNSLRASSELFREPTAKEAKLVKADRFNYSGKKESPLKHSLHVKIAALVLLMLLINGNKICNTTDAFVAHEWKSSFQCRHPMISEHHKNITTQ